MRGFEGRRHGWWAWAQWLIIPMLVFLSTEYAIRGTFVVVPRWYAAAEDIATRGRVDVVFIGSSRVIAAIDTASFDSAIFTLTGHCLRSLNLGRGYSTEAEHYLGLRNLLTSSSAHLEGMTVFIEAPGGLPTGSTWDDAWVLPPQPALLVDVLRWKDLGPFWMSANGGVAEKLHVTLRFGLQPIFSTLNRRERIRERLLEAGIPWLVNLGVGRISSNPFREDPAPVEPVGAGGIRADPATIVGGRELAIRLTDEWLAEQRPIRNWSATIQQDMVELVRRHRGHVVFFDVPQSSVFSRLYATPLRKQDIRLFEEHAQGWDSRLLRPRIAFSDDDFPDLWHVGSWIAAPFSAELAKEWVNAVQGTNELPKGSRANCP
jgi:hypothetical protein